MGEDISIFLNLDEFADEHEIAYEHDSYTIQAVVQSPTAKEMFQQSSNAQYSGYDGIVRTDVIVHCRTRDLPEVPAEGIVLRLDGVIYIVDSCVDDMGMLSISLHANERR